MKPIITFLMFESKAEEAARFYVSLFKDSKIQSINRYSETEIEELGHMLPDDQLPGKPGDVKVVTFTLNGQEYHACNGGPFFKFNHGISMYVRCETQTELDDLWKKLSDGGEIEQCGWVRDKFGVPWQVAPAELDTWLNDSDPKKAARVSSQVYRMKKLDFAPLRHAFEGELLPAHA